MDNIKGNAYYLQKIMTDLQFVCKHTQNLTLQAFNANEVLQDCLLFRLVQIAENSERLTEDFKSLNSQVPWRYVKGMRNRIVHDYGKVDLQVIYDTVTKDIPQMLSMLQDIIPLKTPEL